MSVGSVRLEPVALELGAADADTTLSVETIGDASGFARLRDEWSQLLAASLADNLFLTWEWLHTWWTHLSGGRKLAILALRRGPRLVALAPFASWGTSLLGLPRLGFLGTGRVGSDYLDLIVRNGSEPDVVASLASHVAREGALLDLRQARLTTSAATGLARSLGRSGGLLRIRRTHRCPYIAFEGRSWEAYLGGLGAEQRYSFHRKRRKLETLHGLHFERVSSETRRRELLPILFELHRLRWRARGGSDGLEGPGLREFHEDLTALALERGWLRLFVLWLRGTPAAALYGFRYGRVFYFYQSGFDPRFAKLSVGMVAMGLAIKSAIEEGAAEFDFLHGEEAYKLHWARRTRRLGRVQVFPGGPAGRASWAAAAAVDGLRSLTRRLTSVVGSTVGGGRRAAPGH